MKKGLKKVLLVFCLLALMPLCANAAVVSSVVPACTDRVTCDSCLITVADTPLKMKTPLRVVLVIYPPVMEHQIFFFSPQALGNCTGDLIPGIPGSILYRVPSVEGNP